MHRRVQPAMRMGGGAARPWPDEPDDDGYDGHTEHRAITRGWALTRLIMLVVACGLGAAIATAIFVTAFVTVLDANL